MPKGLPLKTKPFCDFFISLTVCCESVLKYHCMRRKNVYPGTEIGKKCLASMSSLLLLDPYKKSSYALEVWIRR